MQCLMDKNNELCPFALCDIQGRELFSDTIYDNCSSKKCTDELIEIYKELKMDQFEVERISTSSTKFSYCTLSSIKDSISYVNSDKCKKLHKTNIKYNTVSNAVTAKFKNTFYTIFTTLLLFIYFIF